MATMMKAAARSGHARSSKTEEAILAIVQETSRVFHEFSSSINNRFIDLKADLDAKHLQNRNDVHRQNGTLDAHTNEIALLNRELTVVKSHVHSMIGTGDGESGALNELRRGQEEMQSTVGEMKSTLTLIEERTRGAADNDRANTQFRWGWRGVAIALGIIGTVATIGSFLLAVLLFLLRDIAKL